MIGENIIRQAAARKGRQGSLFELYSWFFMRVSGAILMVIVVFHLLYMHFFIPGGVANIDYNVIVGRWTGRAGTFVCDSSEPHPAITSTMDIHRNTNRKVMRIGLPASIS